MNTDDIPGHKRPDRPEDTLDDGHTHDDPTSSAIAHLRHAVQFSSDGHARLATDALGAAAGVLAVHGPTHALDDVRSARAVSPTSPEARYHVRHALQRLVGDLPREESD
ncbi:hypothetical protein JCM17823_04890 [Halorubrum gandharaense]